MPLRSRRDIVIWRNHLCTLLESMLLYPQHIYDCINPHEKSKVNFNFLISVGILYWYFHENSPLFSINRLISLNTSAVSKTVSFTVALFLTSSLKILGNVLRKNLGAGSGYGPTILVKYWPNEPELFQSEKEEDAQTHERNLHCQKARKWAEMIVALWQQLTCIRVIIEIGFHKPFFS